MATRRAPELTSSMRFDLAGSNLTDEELDDVLGEFGATRPGSGWGFSNIFRELLSAEPKSVGVGDLERLQKNLVLQGYMTPGTAVTGVWSPEWYGGFRRWDRDNVEQQFAGKHWLAAPVSAGIRLITNTLPSRVYQGVVGTAKGIVEQAPETGERLGALGGAAGGAVIGSLIPGIGTALGAAGGALFGFLSDLFGDDADEAKQGEVMSLLDPLIPNEWFGDGGARKFFEDLGWVASAASMVAGAGLAARGVSSGVAAVRGTTSVPGLLGRLRGMPVERPGWFTRITAAATKPVFGSNRVERAVDFARNYGLLAQANRPVMRTISGAYTGASSAQLGARVASGFGSGESETTIEKAIREAPELPHYVDLAGFIIYPRRFFPFEGRKVAAAASKVLGDASLWPYVHVAQEAGGSIAGARTSALRMLGRDPAEQALMNTRLRLDYGMWRRQAEMVDEAGLMGFEPLAQGVWNKARADLIGKLRKEGEAGTSDLSRDLLSYSLADRNDGSKGPAGFASWLLQLGNQGRGLDRVHNFLDAERLALRVTRELGEGVLPRDAVRVLGGSRFRGGTFAQAADEAATKRLLDRAQELERQAGRAPDAEASVTLQAEANKLRTQAEEMKRSLPQPGKSEPTELVITPERLDTPTQRDLYQLRRDFLAARDEVVSTFKAGGEGHGLARGRMAEIADDLAYRGIVPAKMAEEAKTAKPPKSIANYLSAKAKGAARDVELPGDLSERFAALGYKPVATGQEVLFSDELPGLSELIGAGDYTRRAAFFDTLGLSPRWGGDRSLFALRAGHEEAELQQVLEEAGVKLSGADARRLLYEQLEKSNNAGAIKGPLVFPREGKARLFKVDARDLTPAEIGDALRASNVRGITAAVERNLYGALKRGAAYGGEAHLLHPVDTARAIGRALRVNGLPGFSDVMRTWRTEPDALILAGAAGGAIVGATEGDEGGDTLRAALGGALLGLGTRAFAKGAYGYLPDRLFRLNSVLRYALSPTFDAGRYMEQNMIAAAKYDLPAIWSPGRYIKQREWRSLYEGGAIGGDDAWREAMRHWDEVNGTSMFVHIDDTDRRFQAAGILGFQPRAWEAAQAYLLAQRGWSKARIAKAVPEIGRYGLGRTAVEKSANFVFFPFSFSKKLILTLGDFVLQAPARGLLIHEGLRRYHESGADEAVTEFLEERAPILKQLWRISNLAYGLSPGRFFLEGLDDNRTNVGKVAQVLTSFFVPSGAATPLAQAAGGAGDLAVHAFVPVVLTGESIDRAGGVDGLDDIVSRYIPLVRDLNRFWEAGSEQVTALAEGKTPWVQFQEFNDRIRGYKAELEPLASVLGYASTDGFLQSDVGVGFKAKLDNLEAELAEKYPTGFEMTTEFVNKARLNEQALYDLAQKPERSPAEEAVLKLAEIRASWRQMGEILGLPEQLLKSLTIKEIRTRAVQHIADRRFVELYERFFASEYGPLVRAA